MSNQACLMPKWLLIFRKKCFGMMPATCCFGASQFGAVHFEVLASCCPWWALVCGSGRPDADWGVLHVRLSKQNKEQSTQVDSFGFPEKKHIISPPTRTPEIRIFGKDRPFGPRGGAEVSFFGQSYFGIYQNGFRQPTLYSKSL